MRKLHTTLYLGLSIFVTIFMILIVVFFFKIIKNKNQHTLAVMTTLENKITEKKDIDILIKKIDHINATHKLVENHFIDSTKIDEFVGYLEKLGDDNQAKVSVRKVEASEDKEKNSISVEIMIEGPFPSIMKIIALLENSPYQIAIESSYINKNLKSKDDLTLVKEQNNLDWQANVTFNILSIK